MQSKSTMIEALSARAQRTLPDAVWHEAFVEQEGRGVSIEQCTLTLLHADAGVRAGSDSADRVQSQLRWLAASHGGRIDHSAAPGSLTLFKDARSALRMALALQHSVADVQFRVGLYTGHCTLAVFRAQERQWAVVVGAERKHAAAMAWNAVAGTVALSAGSHEALGTALDDEVGGAMVSEEFDGAALVQATVILPPRPEAFQSSFAGLGLT
ncbi:MAG: response regulator [Ramlibacter sp.]|nr:response regulator [Ramlibacter sp.]